MKFKVVEGKVLKGMKAKVMIQGTSIPVDIYYQITDYNTFDKAVRAQYKDAFKQYYMQPQHVWEDETKDKNWPPSV